MLRGNSTENHPVSCPKQLRNINHRPRKQRHSIDRKIINASDRDHLLTFLTEEEFLSLNSIFGSAINGWKVLAPAAERCLEILTKLNSNQLQSIGRIIQIEGVRGAIKRTLYLVESTIASEEPTLDDNNVNDGKNAASVDLLEEEDCNHTDVYYISELLTGCEMLDKEIPQRNNSERGIDIAIIFLPGWHP
ncbi:hypothetical protein BC938DRAFT_473380 [Jimgerdemannia flammicorona]|uniref:Uncharacterized protein n=1 Tax=Jimgerdemannia flammicorona TaxID=994334 RepID=A0A433QTF3_9FUNG|nr:hypothetical protein BC938DRAFT_473380 [Jimgerdemannia flammicorona]